VIYVAGNMLVCAVVMAPWALPRETISGFFGRLRIEGRLIGRIGAAIIDLFHWWEPDHCRVTARQEHEARRALYGG
jgi:hypothetical protein